jgi:hypothetical protein
VSRTECPGAKDNRRQACDVSSYLSGGLSFSLTYPLKRSSERREDYLLP